MCSHATNCQWRAWKVSIMLVYTECRCHYLHAASWMWVVGATFHYVQIGMHQCLPTFIRSHGRLSVIVWNLMCVPTENCCSYGHYQLAVVLIKWVKIVLMHSNWSVLCPFLEMAPVSIVKLVEYGDASWKVLCVNDIHSLAQLFRLLQGCK